MITTSSPRIRATGIVLLVASSALQACANEADPIAEDRTGVSNGDTPKVSVAPAQPVDSGREPTQVPESDAGTECRVSSDCRIAQRRCCQDCSIDEPFEAMSQIEFDELLQMCMPPKCGPPRREAGELQCPEGHDYVTAVCRQGRCERVDLLETRFTECDSDADCSLRFGAGCCSRCSFLSPTINGLTYYAGGIVAVSNFEEFIEAFCPLEQDCDECTRQAPEQVSARCVSGRCTAAYDGSPIYEP
jgi:hypothetical protein